MRKYPVLVVRMILEDDSGRTLILKRAETNYGNGSWCLPGGKVDFNVTVEQACIDELKEETDLNIISTEFLVYQNNLPDENYDLHCVSLYFKVQFSGDVKLNEESTDFRWVFPEEIDKYNIVFKNDEIMKQVFCK